jgi:hypothetical protein
MSDNDILYRPWGVVTSEFWGRPQPTDLPAPVTGLPERNPASHAGVAIGTDAEGLPEAYKDGILLVISAFSAQEPQILHSAITEAQRLDQAMTFEYGEHDLRTISMREMRGWLAHLTGQHEVATRWYLHTVGALSSLVGASDDRTRASAKRCVVTWLAIKEAPAAQELAPAVLAMAEAVEGKDSACAKVVRRHTLAAAPALA